VWGQPLVLIDIAANAFLRHMVRNLVGTLIQVGEGRIDADRFAAVLAGDDRRARVLAPAHGLYLMAVRYPEDGTGAADEPAAPHRVTETRMQL
jgi:tRNA pseudouridine38-40 synthase